jgi:hypothetical protein
MIEHLEVNMETLQETLQTTYNTWTPLRVVTEFDTLSESLEHKIERKYSKEMLEYFQEEAKQTGMTLREVYEEDLACQGRADKIISTLKFKPIDELWKLKSFRENMETDEKYPWVNE